MLAGIEAAQKAGLTPLKVNAVLMRGINDDEAIPLLETDIRLSLKATAMMNAAIIVFE